MPPSADFPAEMSTSTAMPHSRRSSRLPDALPTRLAAVVGIAALTGVLVLSGCDDGQASNGADGADRSPPTTRVETLVLQQTSFTDVIEVTGTIEALDDATLSAQTDGPVTMLKDLGTRVEGGEPVATIDAEEAEAAVEQAQAQFDLAQDRFERQEPLYRDSIISALEFEQVRSERNQARASLQQAQTRLSNAILDAPFSGTVEERFLEVGE